MDAQPRYLRRAMNNRQFGLNLGLGDKDNQIKVDVDKDKGFNGCFTIFGKKLCVGAGKPGVKVQIPN